MSFERKWKCSFPWQQVIVDVLGNVHPCCHWSGNEPCGNINEQSLDEIWNGPVFTNLREGMAENDLKKAGCDQCMVMKQKLWQDFFVTEESYSEDNSVYKINIDKNYEEYSSGATQLESPPTRISYSGRAACNLKCYYCYQNNHKEATVELGVWEKEIEPILPKASEIIWGGGEPLIQKEFRRFLDRLDDFPHLRFSTTTNGHPVKKEYLDKLEQLPAVNIHLSIDAGTPDTYRTHRIGGELDELLEILKMLVEYRDKNVGHWKVSWGFLVMRTNIHEMADAIRLAEELTIPISLSPIENYPMEERLDFFNDYATETEGMQKHLDEAREALVKHRATMQKLADKDDRYKTEVHDSSMNIDYIERTIKSAKPSKKYEESRTVRVKGLLKDIPEIHKDKIRITYYSVNDKTNSTEVFGYAVPKGKNDFELKLPPGTYTVALEKEWSYGFGDHLLNKNEIEFADGDEVFVEVLFPNISVHYVSTFTSEDSVEYSFNYDIDEGQSDDSNGLQIISTQVGNKSPDKFTFIELKNLLTGRHYEFKVSPNNLFEFNVEPGFYSQSVFELLLPNKGSNVEITTLHYIPCIDLTNSRMIGLRLSGGFSKFVDEKGKRIPDTDVMAELPVEEQVQSASKLASPITYSGEVVTEEELNVSLRLTWLDGASSKPRFIELNEGGSFEAQLPPGIYRHEIVKGDGTVIHFLPAIDLTTERFIAYKIYSDLSSAFFNANGETIPVEQICTEVPEIKIENPHAADSGTLFVGNIANNSYNNVKFLRKNGEEADALIYDYFHVMGQPEWEDARISGEVDEYNPDWHAVDLNGYELPTWFRKVSTSDYFSPLKVNSTSFNSQLAGILAFAGNRTPLGKLPKYWNVYNYFNNKHVVEAARARVSEVIEMYDRELFDTGILPHRLTEQEVYDYLVMSQTHENIYGEYSSLVLCDINPVWGLFQKRPFVAFEHGTLRDIPFENTAIGKLLALAYKKAEKVVITNCDCVEAAEKLKLNNYCYIPHPIDTYDKYCPQETALGKQLKEKYKCDYLIFAPARHNWQELDGNVNTSSKGNHKMVRGMQMLKEAGINAKLIFSDWGNDVEATKRLIKELDVEDRIIWISPISKVELADYYNACDVILDQFNIGAFGSTMVEAMACEKPVLIYLNTEQIKWAFPVPPPIVNVKEGEEIGNELIKLLSDSEYLNSVAKDSYDWVEKYHSADVVTDKWKALLNEAF